MKKTLLNLTKAFLWESQARNRYTLYAGVAKKEWYIQISNIFLETAEQERQHSKWFFNMLQELKKKEWINDEMIEVPSMAAVKFGDTMTNLKTSMAWEHEEYAELYPEFAKVAEEEWYPEFAKRIRAIMVAEIHHEERYKKLYEQLEKETIWNKEESITWVCTECGYTHNGKNPPELCPSCDHPIGYYIRKCEEY